MKYIKINFLSIYTVHAFTKGELTTKNTNLQSSTSVYFENLEEAQVICFGRILAVCVQRFINF